MAVDIVYLNYIDRRGDESERQVTVQGAEARDGYIYLVGFCHLAGARRVFRNDGILGLADGESGEELDAVRFFGGLLDTPSADIRKILASPGRRRRVLDFGIEFDRIAAGWTFAVAAAHRPSLDIEYVARVERITDPETDKPRRDPQTNKILIRRRFVWARGRPPVLSFSAGDIFFSPPELANVSWGEALAREGTLVQVVAAIADDHQDAIFSHGTLIWKEWRLGAGRLDAGKEVTATQSQFVEYLRSGVIGARPSTA